MAEAMEGIGTALERITRKLSQSTPTNLPVRLPATGPVERDHLCDVYLPRLVCWCPDKGPVALVRALDAEERGRLAALAVELEHCLMPFGDDERTSVRLAITVLFNSFRYMLRHEGISVETSVEVLMAMLREFPAWAIAQGCGFIAREDRTFAPNDGQIYAEVEYTASVQRNRLSSVRALLAAEVADRTPLVQTPRKTIDRIGDGQHTERVLAELEAKKVIDAQRIEPAEAVDT